MEWKSVEKIDLWLFRAEGWVGGGDKEMIDKVTEGFFWGDVWRSYRSVNTLKTIELYTLIGWIVWYVNYISVRLFFKSLLENAFS